MNERDRFFVPENHVVADDTVHRSASGKYELVIEHYITTNGGWRYSQGLVYAVEDGRRILSTVRRNYDHFPFAWVEDHPDGHDYLVCGRHYMGQTIICLNALPGRAAEVDIEPAGRNAFCWAEITPSPDARTLAVEGCIWGGPFDIRIYDFSRPFQTLIQIGEIEVLFEDFGRRWVDADTFEIQEVDAWHPDYDDEQDDGKQVPQRIRRWRRDAAEVEIIALPKDQWLPYPDEGDDDAMVLADGPSVAELIREDRD